MRRRGSAPADAATEISVRLAAGPADLTGARALRERVFCDEQGVSREGEFDGRDDEALHVVAIAGERGVIGTCRLLFDHPGECRLGRMAVDAAFRRHGVGQAMMEVAEHAAGERGAVEVVLHAQRRAESFYAACGYAPEGPTFEEEGIPHVAMRKGLR